MISLENLKGEIQSSVNNLLQLADHYCWNVISSNIIFILSDFNEFKEINFLQQREWRRRMNNSKETFSLESVVEILYKEYHDLYDVNLYIFRSFKKETIIEIQFYRKSNFDAAYFALVKDNSPMFHSKITMPGYAVEGRKFDVNWESGGQFDHAWKNLIYRLKGRRMSFMSTFRVNKFWLKSL